MDSPNSLHPFLASNSDHAMNHLGDYNCSVRTYAKVSSLSFKFQVLLYKLCKYARNIAQL